MDRHCTNCGQAPKPNDRLCTNCGAEIYETPSLESSVDEVDPNVWPPKPVGTLLGDVARPIKLLTKYPWLDWLTGFGATVGLTFAWGLGLIVGILIIAIQRDHKYLRDGAKSALWLFVAIVLGVLAMCFYEISHA